MGDSERRQLALAEAYCARNGLKLSTESFRDKGISAFHGKHHESGALGRLLAHVKPGDTVLIEDSDRWSREDPLAALNRLRAEVETGVEIVFLRTGQRVTRENFDDVAVIVPNFFGSLLANQESRKKGERVKASWAARRVAIRAGQPARFRLPCWLRWDETAGKPAVKEAAAGTVRKLFELAAAGRGMLEIARALHASGIPTVTGSKSPAWNLTSLRRILRGKEALGYYVPRTGEPVAGYYPAIISEQLYYAAQARLGIVKTITRRLGCDSNLFTGLLHCSKCGSSLTTAGGFKYTKLICQGARQGRSDCGFSGVPVAVVEAGVFDFLGQTDVLRPALAGAPKPSKLDALAGQLESAKRQATKLAAVIVSDPEPSPLVYAALKAAEAAVKSISGEIDGERAKASLPVLAGYENFLLALPALLKDAHRRPELRRAVNAVVENIALDPKGNGDAWQVVLKLRGSAQSFLLEVTKGGWRLAGIT
jgi:DNA invertase Pin-like site-specific DNA recombinase